MMQISTRKQIRNHRGTILVCSYDITRKKIPEPLRAHRNSAKECIGLLIYFKKKMQQTEFHSRYLIEVKVTVHSLLLNITDTINSGTKMDLHDRKRKTLPQDYRRHLCAPSPSNRRRSMATHRLCWLQRPQDEAHPSF